MKNISKKNWVLYIVTFLVVVIGDQLTKILVSSSMMLGQSQAIIDNFFYYTYSHNQGGHISLFVVVSLAAAISMFYYFSKTTKAQRLTRYGIVLTFAGLVGNLTDRLYFGYVRDFIDFIIFGYDFPIFNIADMAVVIGVGLIILEIIFEDYINGKKKIRD